MQKNRQQPQEPQQFKAMLKNPALERAVLNSLINQSHYTDYLLQYLTDSCFYEPKHLVVFHAIREVYQRGETVSMITVAEELERNMGGFWDSQMLFDTVAISVSDDEPMDPSYQLKVLTEYACRRALGPVAAELTMLATTLSENLTEGIGRVEEKIQEALGNKMQQKFQTLTELLQEARQVIRENLDPATRHTGILTDIPKLDEAGGLQRGAFVVIAAKSSHGKTSFANYLALHAMRHGNRVAYFSMEMTNLEIVQRFLAMESGVNSNAIARLPLWPDHQQEVEAAAQRLDTMGGNLWFDRSMTNDYDHMVQCIRAMRKQQGLDLVVVDYLQLLRIGDDMDPKQRTQRLAWASHRFKDLARQTGVTIIGLSQINRDHVGIPTSESLLDSSAIKQAADMVIMLYCAAAEGVHGVSSYPSPYQDLPAKDSLLAIIDKGRQLGTMHFLMRFVRPLTLLTPWTDEDDEPKGNEVETWVQKELDF